MVRTVRDSSSLESELRPLLDAANTTTWKRALKVLCVNGAVLEALEESGVLALISARGDAASVSNSSDLLQGRAKVELTPLIAKLARAFLPKMIVAIKGSVTTEPAGQKTEAQVNEKVMVAIATSISGAISDLEKRKKELVGAFVSGAFTFSDIIAVSMFSGLRDLRGTQLRSGLTDNEYEDMISDLKRLGLVSPRLQISICPNCANYEFSISPSPATKSECSRCGSNWPTLTLYLFSEIWNNLKKDNSDFPLFISSYLRQRIMEKSPLGEVEIQPKAVLALDQSPKTVEIDVWLPQFNLGIECKVYENPLAPVTRTRLGSMVGELSKQIENYREAGITKVLVVTNLPTGPTDRLGKAIGMKLAERKIKLDVLQFVAGSTDGLLMTLDGMATEMAKAIMNAYEKSLEQPRKQSEGESVSELPSTSVSPSSEN